MSKLDQIIRSGRDGAALLFRRRPYDGKDQEVFLRDVIALANAEVEGTRLIVVGVDKVEGRDPHICPVPQGDFSRDPSYQDIAREFIEPPLRLRYLAHEFDGARIGLIEISDCHDRPYMMRIDHSAALRRGDAWIRAATGNFRMGRSQLEAIFAAKLAKPDRGSSLELGFRGDYVLKELYVPVHDKAELPSAAHQARLRQMLEVEKQVAASGGTTRIVRLTHARLFGAESEYVNADCQALEREIENTAEEFWHEDQNHMFVSNGASLDFVIFNHGEALIREASLAVVMPNLPELFVARSLPGVRHDDRVAGGECGAGDAYPSVGMRSDGAIFISDNIGDIAPGAMRSAFRVPPRIFAASALAGTRMAVRYELSARDLAVPSRGRLKVIFTTR